MGSRHHRTRSTTISYPASTVAVALRPVTGWRVGLAVLALAAGAVASVTVAWPAAMVLAILAVAIDVPTGPPFALHRAAALVATRRGAPRRGWRQFLPLERAGPEMILNRPLNGLLLAMLLASVVLLFVETAVAVALAAVLCATYACLGRPERAWVPTKVLAAYAQLAAPAPGRVAAAPLPAGRSAAVPEARSSDLLPLTGPQILARIDAIAGEARSTVPAEAAATLQRIRLVAREALPADDRPLDFTDQETWLVRQAACDYLPTAIERYLALKPALRGRRGPDGRSPDEVLVDSLRAIEGYFAEAVMRSNERDTMALLAYERFLRDRLARSSGLRVEPDHLQAEPENARARERV